MKAYATQMICETDPRELIHKYIYCSNQGFFEAGFGSGIIIPRQFLKISAKKQKQKQKNKQTNIQTTDSQTAANTAENSTNKDKKQKNWRAGNVFSSKLFLLKHFSRFFYPHLAAQAEKSTSLSTYRTKKLL
jgi:hypothetical protein